ncbi:MAG TPA: PHB depolymerase family esterase [Candidatus Acidoferrum sp.]|jgi:poly(3-hydroxybutyrate) depolymerase|nr:PHB depolymerase family esterase [Candidatus Acidoferrum sp.]
MKRSLSAVAFPLVLGSVLFAQDAGMVLRTSVTYNTQKATLTLTDEQRRQAEELARQAQQANQAGKYGDAMRSLYQGLSVMRNMPWTPALEFASSLQGKLDHAIVEPGAAVAVTLSPLYDSPRAAEAKLTAACFLIAKTGSATKAFGTPVAVDPAGPFTTRLILPEAAPGDYTIEVRLSTAGEAPAVAAPAAFVKSLPVHIDSLAEPVQRLRVRLKTAPKKDGFDTAAYALALYQRADAGEVNPGRVDFREEFAAATAILDALDAGKEPFSGKHGDSHRAYRSNVDGLLQPYRLFIPDSYDGSKATPLVVALHGMGGDENSMFDSYSSGLLKREAERHGFLVVCPKGRDTASMYRGSAEQDVLDVMAEVQRSYRVDGSRIYLMGHSMGAYGTWSIAMAHPDLFAALGPISGGGVPAGMVKIRHIPEYVVHGDDDRTVAVTQSRTMVEAGKKAGAEIVYVEVPGGSHVGVAAPAFAGMLEFFAKQHKAANPQ